MTLIFIDQTLPQHRPKPSAVNPQSQACGPRCACIRDPKSFEMFLTRLEHHSIEYWMFRYPLDTTEVSPAPYLQRLLHTKHHRSRAKFFVIAGDSIV